MKDNTEARKKKELKAELHHGIELLTAIHDGFTHERKKNLLDNLQAIRLNGLLDNFEEQYGIRIESRHQARKLLRQMKQQLDDVDTAKLEKAPKKEKGCRGKQCYRPQTTR